MLILSWNIRSNCGIARTRLAQVASAIVKFNADIVLLQEVYGLGNVPEHLRKQLGMPGWYFSGIGTGEKKYGNVIASRYSVEARACETLPAAPWPQLLASATVGAPTGPIEVVSAHMPNGSKHGWKKIETFEALASAMAHTGKSPRIVGGDFNEPQTILAGNRVLSFAANKDGKVAGLWRGAPLARWQSAVEGILTSSETNVHAWLSRNADAVAATHVVRGKERFFDHLLLSEHFDILDAGFTHVWRQGTDPMSDHSGAWAEVSFKPSAAGA